MHAETTLFIAPDHPAFAGHFPGMPILPGVVLLDAAMHTALQAMRTASSGDRGEDGAKDICQISSAKFLSPVSPGETLTISCTTSASGSTRFDISSGSRKVATGTLVLSPASGKKNAITRRREALNGNKIPSAATCSCCA